MKNLDKTTPITRSPCLASLGSNPTISIMAKPKMWITKVLGGGCPSKDVDQTLRLWFYCSFWQ